MNQCLDIWDAYDYKGTMADGFKPTMTTYIRTGEKTRGLVVVFPGGGYSLTSPREAEPIAISFNNAGYHAVFVDYSVSPRRHPQALLDAARVLSIVKENAEAWKVDMTSIYVCGFSAGAHLCASISNMYQEEWLRQSQGIEIEGLKIKGSILAYPVIVYGDHMHKGSFINLLGENAREEAYEKLSMEKCVHPATPPTFIWHTFEDPAVPVENALMYANALRQYDIPFELHIYPKGGHGLSLATEEVATSEEGIIAHVASWMKLCIEWMED